MTDFRDRVNADRGLIKTVQLAIPGYRGYRKKEDLRIADRLLREELANRLSVVITDLEGAKKVIRGIRPRQAILTHFGFTMIRSKPWEVAAEVEKDTGIRTIAASDGMEFDLEKELL